MATAQDSEERAGVLADFELASAKLKAADPAARMAVGISLNTLSTAFAATFQSPEEFQNTPYKQQNEYLKKLAAAEAGMVARDPDAGLGFGLFKIWICALVTKDAELLALIKPELVRLSHEGDLKLGTSFTAEDAETVRMAAKRSTLSYRLGKWVGSLLRKKSEGMSGRGGAR